MNQPDPLIAAVSATVADSDSGHRDLLQSVVATARAIFGAQASSILLLDQSTGELVFEASSGRGENSLVGTRFPAGQGIAGWVAVSGEPMVVDDLSQETLFARDIAESTQYVPRTLMAAPLLHDEVVLGVLEVLDRAEGRPTTLDDMDLLAMFASQAAVSLALVQRNRLAQAVLRERGTEFDEVIRLVNALTQRMGPRRDAGLQLIAVLAELL
ncbi:GAF domain-containing protein [Streptomyces sp. V4-01]|uniref:GAF domain-containing protein n=1 Tax=Actinacidiphila polyblastidii TaxID=3110430 RepID=A0ABU7PLL0_9ACTN|nr:GAF domain-containing protein [Streptomyces sp. V4-01]